MNKYQEALNRIIDEYIPMSFDGKPMNQQTADALILQELVWEKTEYESRKDKLIVGSEWECVYQHSNDLIVLDKSDVVFIKHVGDKMVIYHCNKKDLDRVDYKDHFTLCFKPIEKGE